MKKDKTTTFGRDYFLEALPVEWDEKLDGPHPSEQNNKKKKGDVQVSASELDVLRSLGLLK